MVKFDWSTGEIMDALEGHGLTENTIVIFSSDNVPVYDDGYDDGTTVQTSTEEVDRGHDGSTIYRGGKYQIYESSTRVPFIVRWPVRIKPAESKALVNQIDLIASFANLLGLELAEDEAPDSRNTLAAFFGEDAIGLPYMIEEAGRANRALRFGEWKYIAPSQARKGKTKSAELYKLNDDPSEATSIIEQNPRKAAMMDAKLKELISAEGVR
jgi:arylsulfatase A